MGSAARVAAVQRSQSQHDLRYSKDAQLSVFRTPSGYGGATSSEYKQPGSNGLALDGQGRLTINEHGNRRVSRLEPDGRITVLADRLGGKRLNSPNDLVYRSDGALFFTDPPFGLPKVFADPRKDLPFSGVYAVSEERFACSNRELTVPTASPSRPTSGISTSVTGMSRGRS